MSKLTAITIPKWGLSMDEGTVVSWLIEEGDTVTPGSGIAEIESSKLVNTLESHVAGVVYRRVAEQDETLPVGALLAVVGAEGASPGEIDAFISEFKPSSLSTVSGDQAAGSETAARPAAQAPAGAEAVTPEAVPESLKTGADDSAVSASPHARRLAKKLGINLNNVRGSGRNQRISVEDIEHAIQVAASGPSISAGSVGIPMSATRQTIARRLQESKSTIPHYRLVADVRVDNMMRLRSQINDSDAAARVSLNDMLLKSCSLALLAAPECNIRLEGDTIRQFTDTDIAIAVALPEALVTPVVRGVNRLSVLEVAREAARLVDLARNRKLGMDDTDGGTMTVSNLGMYGVKQFDAIINPPQCVILAAGSAEKRVIVEADAPAIATMMTLTLSLDHRAIDGAVGARLLQSLCAIIQDPDPRAFGFTDKAGG